MLEVFELVRVGSSTVGCDLVHFELKRADGTQFIVTLSADHGQRLVDDLPEQISTARSSN